MGRKQAPAGRPPAVTVLAGLFVLLGTGLIFLSGMGLATYYGLPPGWRTLSSDVPASGWRALLRDGLRHLNAWLAVQALVGGGMVYVAVQFYRLRSWARRGLEGLVGLGMIAACLAGGLWYRFVTRLGSVLRSGGRSLSSWGVTYLMVLGLLVVLFVLLVLAGALMHLRGAAVRRAMKDGHESP